MQCDVTLQVRWLWILLKDEAGQVETRKGLTEYVGAGFMQAAIRITEI